MAALRAFKERAGDRGRAAKERGSGEEGEEGGEEGADQNVPCCQPLRAGPDMHVQNDDTQSTEIPPNGHAPWQLLAQAVICSVLVLV
jgi:hypothetical protein